MKTKITLPFCFILTFLFYHSNAQQTTAATGGNIHGAGGSISYTVGQVATQFQSATNGSVAQGVQQPYEIFVLTAIDEANGISLDFQVYPNPATDYLKLSITGLAQENLLWKINDLSGKLLGNESISAAETFIPMTNYTAGIYLLSVVDKHNRQFKTFKIIKN